MLSAVNTMTIVMAVVAGLMLVYYIASSIQKVVAKRRPAEPSQEAKESVEEGVTLVKAPGSCGNIVLKDTTPREAAMVMSIVSYQMETPLNELRFKNIKKIGKIEDKK